MSDLMSFFPEVSVRIGGSSGLLVAMVGDALPAGSGEPVTAGGSHGDALASVFLVGVT